ncbi:MAG TPA: nucleotide exchange factor GrpE [Candidatus Pacearchaeota archaeon]|nr:nucleotide exchange factor GrpE [Candidatus Pacearchaeota archaeon]HOK94061.1 nucleotide exchange factor GrpE [Candidatus Pacearchaeota archaeon]HPO75132.1 nucleotide exchange factor GrpE [Candidatus Pacearchaeota archaeon]
MEEENKNKKEKKTTDEVEYIEEGEEKNLDLEKKIEKLKEKLKICQKEKEEYLAGWQRERADFLNYKRDEEKKLEEKIEFFKKKILLEFLSVLDSIERAEKNLPEEMKENSWAKGVLGIKKQIEGILRKEGVEEIEIDEDFNPELCEAVEVIEGEEGKVIEVSQKGYLLNKKVLRPAKVKVGKGRES